MRRAALPLLAVVAWSAPALAQPVREETIEYTVQAGDTCVGIAQRELGDREEYVAIHRLNPKLGKLPHVLKPGQKLRLPRPAAPAPEWRPGVARKVAGLFGPGVTGGGTIRAAWYPVPAAEGYRLDVHRVGGGRVLDADLRRDATEVELRDVPAGGYVLTLSARAGGRSGAPSDALAITVVGVTVAIPGLPPTLSTLPDPKAPLAPPVDAAAPAAPPVIAVGAAVGDPDMMCEVHGRDGAPLVLVSPGRAALLCTTAPGVMLEPLEIEVAAVTAEAYGDGGPLTMVRGERAQLELVLRSAGALADRWRVDGGPGLTVGELEIAKAPEPGIDKPPVLRVGVTAAATAPDVSRLTIHDALTGARVAVAEVHLRDRAPRITEERPRPRLLVTRPRPALTAGLYAGWTSFPRGVIEGSELGDPALDDYQVASGGGGGMRAAWWWRRDLFVEADVVLVPTGFVAADEPAWIAGGHLFAGLAAVDGPRYGLRGMIGAGGYALLGDAAYARADLDADITYGVSGTLRLTRDLSLRLDGRHHIAPDRGDGGVTDVLEATLGIEAIVYSAP